MNSRCRAAVEHFQLIAMQDFRFNAHFKRACRLDISRFCPNIKAKYDCSTGSPACRLSLMGNKLANYPAVRSSSFYLLICRAQVVACLSETVRNDSITLSSIPRNAIAASSGPQHRISQPCRQQLRSQLLQQHENVAMNPGVRKPCSDEEKKFCAQIKPGQGRILECLKAHRKQLGRECHAAIFQVEKEEMDDSSVDFQLSFQCKDPIRRFCPNDPSKALECLKVIPDSLN